MNNNYYTSNSTNCAGTWILGGWKVLGNQSFINNVFPIAGYNTLTVSFNFYAIDSWVASNYFSLYINGVQVWSTQYNSIQGTTPTQLCGKSDPDTIFNVNYLDSNFNTSLTSVNISLTTTLTLDPYNASWGVRNLFIENKNCSVRCSNCVGPGPGECSGCKWPYYYLPLQGCLNSCPSGYWQDNVNYLCIRCNVQNCADCTSDVKICTTCKTQSYPLITAKNTFCISKLLI